MSTPGAEYAGNVTYVKDPAFYVALDAMAQRCGAKAEDLLLIWTSESNLRADLRWPPPSGDASQTFSTMMKNVFVPNGIDAATWAKLPSMSHVQQLPFVERGVYGPAHRTLGRMFRDTFETYLVNAAPGMLRADGNYNPRSPMYVGENYPDNWTMDNAPAGLNAALKEGIKLGPRARDSYDFCKELVARGVLKGYVSLGDLQTFGKRILSSAALGGGTFSTAVSYLNNVRDHVSHGQAPSIEPFDASSVQVPAAPPAKSSDDGYWLPDLTHSVVSGAPSSYHPDFDSSVSSGAPVDSRIATPEAARKKMPAKAGGSSPNHLPWPVVALGVATGVGVAVALSRK